MRDITWDKRKQIKNLLLQKSDWNQLIDLPVVDETGSRSLATRLAVILYEITFWGRTRHSVLHEAETLKFESDNIVPFSLDELTELE